MPFYCEKQDSLYYWCHHVILLWSMGHLCLPLSFTAGNGTQSVVLISALPVSVKNGTRFRPLILNLWHVSVKNGTHFRPLTLNLCHVSVKKGTRFKPLTLNLCHVSVKKGTRFRPLTLNLCHVIISAIPKDGTHVSVLISSCLQCRETGKRSFTVAFRLSFYSGRQNIFQCHWFHCHYIVMEQTLFVSSDFSHCVSLQWRAGHCLLPLSSLSFSCGKRDIVTATDYTVWETGHCSLALMSMCLFTVRNKTVFIVVYCNSVILWCKYGEKCNSCHYWFHQVPNCEGLGIFCCCCCCCCSSHRAILSCYSPFKKSFLILLCHLAVCVILALSKNTALYPLA